MKHLWAPWRMAYVAGTRATGCVFCGMAGEDDDVRHNIVHRGEHCFAVLNAFPYNAGHLMVVPYSHVPDLDGLSAEQLTDMMQMAQLCMRALGECMRPEGFNLGMNIGRAAGAGIDEHVHLHVVPRWSGDTNYMTTVHETRVVPQSLYDCAARLAPSFERLAGAWPEQDQD